MLIVAPLERRDRRAGRHEARRRHRPRRSPASALALLHAACRPDISYSATSLWRMVLMAIGMALTMAPATESIMGSLPLRQGRRRFGGERHDPPGRRRARCRDRRQRDVVDLRRRRSRDLLAGTPIAGLGDRADGQGLARRRAGAAAQPAVTPARDARRRRAKAAFVDGMHPGVLVAAGAALLGAIVAAFWLPARAPRREPRAPGRGVRRGACARRRASRRDGPETPAELR